MIAVAILGAGIGQAHLDAYLALPDVFTVATLCDVDLARAQSVVRQVAGAGSQITLSPNLDDVLADDAIDLVDICLPPHLHLPVARAALRAGKHVVCEKPVTTSLKDADALIADAAAANRTVSPVFQYRFGPAMSQLKALMGAGLAGRPLVASLETHWNRDAAYYAVPWRGTFAGESGGCVLGHAIHTHDLLTDIMGPVACLSAHTDTRVNAIEVEDCAAIALQMQNGALATSSITLGAANDTTRLRFVFEGLTAQSGTAPYAPASDAWTFTARRPEDQPRADAVVGLVGEVRCGFEGFFTELAKLLRGEASRAVTMDDGRRSIELVTAIYHAARTRTTVTLPLGTTMALYGGWVPPQRDDR